jgi:hypothetical protein
MSNNRDDKTDTKAVTDAKGKGVVEGAGSTDASTDATTTDSALPKGKTNDAAAGGKKAAKSVRQVIPAETPAVEDPLGWARDIFADINRTEAKVDQTVLKTGDAGPQSARNGDAARNDDDLDFEPLDDAAASAVRALYELGDETPVEIARSTKPSRDAQSVIPLTGSDPRFEIDHEAELEAATQAMVLNMGAAADTAVAATDAAYPKLPRLHQLCWLGLSGVDHVMRRAAAADVVRALPDLADACLSWMEAVRANEAETLGLTLAARIDHRAFSSGDPSLYLLATGVLMASLQAPLLRHVVVDHVSAGERLASKHPNSAGHGPFMQADTPEFGAGAPVSLEMLQTLRLLDAGITPLPLGERRISLTEPAGWNK